MVAANDNRSLVVKAPCRLCAGVTALMVNHEDWSEYCRGEGYIQELFPYLSAGEREVLMSNTCESCWNEIFPPSPSPDVDNDE